MVSTKDIHDFMATRDILRVNIEMFHAGTRELYRVVAGELRKLTCDGKSTLLKRICPSIEMHQIQSALNKMPENCRERLVLHIPSTIYFDGKGGSNIISLFDIHSQMISLDEWLDQPLFNKDITIRNFIRSVSDKESVHSDKEYNETLLFSKSVKLVNEDMHKQHIVAIGEYVLSVMERIIKNDSNIFETNAANQ